MKAFKTWPAAALASGLVAQAVLAADPGVANLQKVWLQCDRLATTTLLDPGTAAECSRVHEQLLQRGFDGDFHRMLAWWQANRVTAQPAPNPLPLRKP